MPKQQQNLQNDRVRNDVSKASLSALRDSAPLQDAPKHARSRTMTCKGKQSRLRGDDTFVVDGTRGIFEAHGEGLKHIGWGLVALVLIRMRFPAIGGLLVLLATGYRPELTSLFEYLLKL